MAERPPAIQFEDVPLDEARRMSRGPRMDAELYHALKEKIQSLNDIATRTAIPEGTSPTTMKNRILRVAAEHAIPVTIRRVPGGLVFWRSTDKDLQQAQQIATRLQSGYLCPTPEHVKLAEMGAPHGPERLGRAGRECRSEVYSCWASGSEPKTCQYRVNYPVF